MIVKSMVLRHSNFEHFFVSLYIPFKEKLKICRKVPFNPVKSMVTGSYAFVTFFGFLLYTIKRKTKFLCKYVI